jgi:hypothetical protein
VRKIFRNRRRKKQIKDDQRIAGLGYTLISRWRKLGFVAPVAAECFYIFVNPWSTQEKEDGVAIAQLYLQILGIDDT